MRREAEPAGGRERDGGREAVGVELAAHLGYQRLISGTGFLDRLCTGYHGTQSREVNTNQEDL